MAGAGEEIARRADIRDAGGADPAVRPRLCYDPFGNPGVVISLARRPETVAGPKAGAGATHINRDQRIAARHEQVAPACDTGTRLALRRREAPQRKPPVIRVKIRMAGTLPDALGGR
jgi:hypothetical protein